MRLWFAFLFIIFSALSPAGAIEDPSSVPMDITPSTQLGAKVDLNLTFTDSNGSIVALRDVMMPGRPALLVPVYYGCPRLCGLVLQGLTTLINQLPFSMGSDYRVIAVSFDHTETPAMAQEKKQKHVSALISAQQKPEAWHFLVGSEDNVSSLMRQIGFKYQLDNGEFSHSAALILLTPQGEISQYFTGVEFPAFDVRLALVEASKGSIGSAIDHVYLFCFRFDQLKGKYIWAAFGAFKVGGIICLLLLGGLVATLLRSERARQREV